MSNTINFGIDLGTTNSAIAKYNAGEIEIFKNPLNLKQTLPSVVAFRKNRIIIGDKAREVLQKDPLNVVGAFKRKMGTSDKYFIESTQETLSAEELSAYVLKELKNFVHTGEQVNAAVITIPASFDTMQSNATKKAGYQAGFEQVVLLQEPIAASLAYANKLSEGTELTDEKWLVYDLGGGTFDVALVSIADEEMKVLDHEGNNYLGGIDFDKAIIEKLMIPHLEKEGTFVNLEKEMKSASGKYNRLYNLLSFKAEEAKIMLTNATSAEIEFEVTDDKEEEHDIYMTITRDQLNEVLQPYIDKTIEMIESVILRNEVDKSDLKFILMIGGSTYIPAVREQLAKRLGIDVNCSIDPTTAVASGAAYYAGMKMLDVKTGLSGAEHNVSEVTTDPSLEIRTAFQKVTQETETVFIVEASGTIKNRFYRITRADGGYDSGLKRLEKSVTEYLPLVKGVFNQFNFVVLDQQGNPIQVGVPVIGINQGMFSIDGQPLPNDICLEVDSTEEDTTYLEPLFKKNDILPVKKTIVKEISRNIRQGTDDQLTINIVEGHVYNLPSANKTIGFVKIAGHDLNRDLIKGSDVELTFEISESRDLKVEVYLTISGQEYENIFNASETHVDLEMITKELKDFNTNLLVKREELERKEKYEEAATVMKLLAEIDGLQTRIDDLGSDDVTDEKYQIDEEKRSIAQQIHRMYSSSVLRTTLEEYYKMKKNLGMTIRFGETQPGDEIAFQEIVKNEKSFLVTDNVSVITMKIDQMRGLMHKINSRQKLTYEDIVHHFSYIRSHEFEDRSKADALIIKGEKALNENNQSALLDAVNQLYILKNMEEKGGGNSFKKGGTGLK